MLLSLFLSFMFVDMPSAIHFNHSDFLKAFFTYVCFFFVVLLLQVFLFFFWFATGDTTTTLSSKEADDDSAASGAEADGVVLGAYFPVVGPEWAWMDVVSSWPNCHSREGEIWRYLTYQLVHAGLLHLFFNVIVQTLFGLPLNLVHGSTRVGIVYECGVVVGALCFVVWDGGYYTLVGASGGVYSIFGMHLAETWLTWSLGHRGVLGRWLRVFAVISVLGVDVALTVASASKNRTTSLPAHFGGLVTGFFGGLLALDTLETTPLHRRLGRPMAWFLGLGLPVVLIILYSATQEFPPLALNRQDPEPCCWQLLRCPNVPRQTFKSDFICDEYSVYPKFIDDGPALETCDEFESDILSASSS